MKNSAILVVSFGTSIPQARRAIDNLVNVATNNFPDYEVRLALTSKIIRQKLANELPNPVEALAKLNDEEFTQVIIMPTLLIPGQEYDELKNVYEAFKGLKGKYGFKKLALGTPFLNSSKDCEHMAEILISRFDSELYDRHIGIVLMGHGTSKKSANAFYLQIQQELDKRFYGKFFVGTVDASPDIHDVVTNLKRQKEIDKLILSPLMTVAGEHAKSDLANEWVNILKDNGYEDISANLIGLGEDKNIANDFVARLKKIIATL